MSTPRPSADSRERASTYIYMYICMYVCVYMCIYIYNDNISLSLSLYLCIYIYIYDIYIYIYYCFACERVSTCARERGYGVISHARDIH